MVVYNDSGGEETGGFLAEHQGGDRTRGERMDLPMFGYFRFQMKRQHFSEDFDKVISEIYVPWMFRSFFWIFVFWRLIDDQTLENGVWLLYCWDNQWWEQISFSWIFLLPLISPAKWYLRWQEFCHWSEFNACCLDQLRISWWSALDQ